VISWRFVYGGDCPVAPGPANPQASIDVTCGGASVYVTNDGENILTASVVVYVDGEFYKALAVAPGDHQSVDIDFPEDSGDHVIEVRTGPAFGDIPLISKTVKSDCKPAVVVPPVVVVPPTVVPPVVAPEAPVTQRSVSAVSPVTDKLAETGSTVQAWPFMLGAFILIVGGIGFLTRRRKIEE